VLRQEPGEGALVARGSGVDYWVAVADKVAVPNLIGRNAGEAMAELWALGLAGEVRGAEESERPEGGVVRQDPAPKTLVPSGSPVGFWVAVPVLIRVPDLSGMGERHASDRLGVEGLVVGQVERRASDEPEGSVLLQEPAAGTRVSPKSLVNLWVAALLEVAVPGVVGSDLDQARVRLSELGLVLASQPPERNVAPEGLIVGQHPAEGMRVPPRTPVSVRVSAGPAPIWPWLVGVGIAAALLAAAGAWWAHRSKPDGTATEPPAFTVRVRVSEPFASAPDPIPFDPQAPEVRLRVWLVPGSSEVLADKLIVREERRET
jgi:beta-lactam-binding protein with PASTA domain